MAARYPIATLEQMAAIPQELWPRLLAEMPDILAATARFMAAAAALDGALQVGTDSFVWVDDGEGELRVTLKSQDGEVALQETGPLASEAG